MTPYVKPLHEIVDERHKDAGGWEAVTAIYDNPKLKYEEKLAKVMELTRVTWGTAGRWYTYYQKMRASK